MVADFSRIEELAEPVINILDHHILNDQVENPTCENLLYWIGVRLILRAIDWSQLELDESPESTCILTRDEFESNPEVV